MPTDRPMRLHSLWRGIQSVLFYYLSCTPWFKFTSRRQRRKQNKQDRAERQRFQLEEAETYRQPSPYRTNPFWAEEIRLGPGPPAKRLTKKQRQTLRTLKITDDVSRGNTPVNDAYRGGTDLKNEDGVQSAIVVPEGEKWKLNQRADEPLWGCEEPMPSSSIPPLRGSQKAASLSRHFPSLDRDNTSSISHIVAVNPAVNDLHPPAVSNPAQGNTSNMWMLQPPPPAAVMSGHDSPRNRSRSTTASSISSRRTGEQRLGRKLSQRLVEEKLRRGGLLYPTDVPHLRCQDAPSQSSLIEAGYFIHDTSVSNPKRGSFIESMETLTHSRSLTIERDSSREEDMKITNGANLPWREVLSGGLQEDFSSPHYAKPRIFRSSTTAHRLQNSGASRYRPSILSGKLALPITNQGPEGSEPTDDHKHVNSSVGFEQLTKSKFRARRKHQDLLEILTALRDILPNEQVERDVSRRWSVDF